MFNSLCLVYTSRETQLTERKGVRKRWKEGGEDGQRDRDREGGEKEGEREKNPYSMNNICSFCSLKDPHSP